MPRVTVVHWNPRKPVLRWAFGERARVGLARENNFGDLLGPLIVDALAQATGRRVPRGIRRRRLLTVGSILQYAKTGDVVWGSGMNGHWLGDGPHADWLDVRAVRGPLTREYLTGLGHSNVPEIYGDPALLLAKARPDLLLVEREAVTTVVPNLNEQATLAYATLPSGARLLDPRSPLEDCLRIIASSDFVVGSSLHGIVVAEALGIPARSVRAPEEPEFKYVDYFRGTGRDYRPAASLEEALAEGPHASPVWDPAPLEAAFPSDMFE